MRKRRKRRKRRRRRSSRRKRRRHTTLYTCMYILQTTLVEGHTVADHNVLIHWMGFVWRHW